MTKYAIGFMLMILVVICGWVLAEGVMWWIYHTTPFVTMVTGISCIVVVGSIGIGGLLRD